MYFYYYGMINNINENCKKYDFLIKNVGSMF